MATKKKTKGQSDKRVKIQDWKSIKWVLNNLDDDTLSQIDATEFDTERYLDWIAHLVDNGFVINFGWDDWSKCYQVTATCSFEGFANSGYAVSARSDEDFVDAVKILWGKIEFVANFDLPSTYEKTPTRSKRG